jgi:hypothetical protein
MSKYRKGIIALAGFAAVLGAVASDGAFSVEDVVALVAAAAAAFGVYQIPNEPPPQS